jgi:hypothetical protein
MRQLTRPAQSGLAACEKATCRSRHRPRDPSSSATDPSTSLTIWAALPESGHRLGCRSGRAAPNPRFIRFLPRLRAAHHGAARIGGAASAAVEAPTAGGRCSDEAERKPPFTANGRAGADRKALGLRLLLKKRRASECQKSSTGAICLASRHHAGTRHLCSRRTSRKPRRGRLKSSLASPAACANTKISTIEEFCLQALRGRASFIFNDIRKREPLS